MQKYKGGCHCGLVQYEVETSLEKVISCNCSHCHAKGLLLTFVTQDKFTLLSGEEVLTEYTFNKKKIQHLFCRACGVQSFSVGIEMPMVAINVRCLFDVEISTFAVTSFDGKAL